MDQVAKDQKISVVEIKGLNERKLYNNQDLGELDILRNGIPTTEGAISRMNGIGFRLQIAGEAIHTLHQTNDSRGNILVKTDQNLYMMTSEEFWDQTAYIPNLNYASLLEEENMSLAIIIHQETSGTSAGSSTTSFAQAKLTNIISQVNADGTVASFASLATNQITLAAGKYRIRGRTTMHSTTAGHKFTVQLYNITTAASLWTGLLNQESSRFNADPVTNHNTWLEFGGYISLAAPTIIELQKKASTAFATGTAGYGGPQAGGSNEIYTWIEILQTA